MKRLTFTLAAMTLAIAACDRPTPPPKESSTAFERIVLAEWPEATAQVYSGRNEQPTRVQGKKKEFTVAGPFRGAPDRIPVVAFVTDRGSVWVGPEQEFYIETGSRIVGGKVFAGTIQWCDSFVQADTFKKMSISEAVELFLKHLDPSKFWDSAFPGFNTDKVMKAGRITSFYAVLPREPNDVSLMPGMRLRFAGLQVSGNTVRFNLEQYRGAYKVAVWIDINSKKLLKVERGGKQLFPKPWWRFWSQKDGE